MTTLRDEILARGFDLKNRDDGAIAEALSVGRTRLEPTEIGIGGILDTLGVATGNALLDAIYTAPDFRYVKPLLERGTLRLDSPLVLATLDSLVPSVLTQAQADALKGLAIKPDVITAQDVSRALEGM